MSPDDWHQLTQAVVQLVYAFVGYLANHYAVKQGALVATAPPADPVKAP